MWKRNAISRVGVIVILLVIAYIIITSIPSLLKVRDYAMRWKCRNNLWIITKALKVYASDYNDNYPVQGAGTHSFGATTTGWDDPKKDWGNSEGTVTVSSSLYLLVRQADAAPSSFICPDSKQTAFVNKINNSLTELWDFGPNPGNHQSYAYQYPYGKFPIKSTSYVSCAIIADRNPWFDNELTPSDIKNENQETFKDKVALIDYTDRQERWKRYIGNSPNHKRRGQNMVFGDGHCSFIPMPDYASRYDNIYTIGGDTEETRRIGTAPTGESIDSVNSADSLLVNDR